MTAVYVLTAGSGDTYRIERVDLDSDEAHRFAQDYRRHRTRGTGAGRGMAGRCPAEPYDGPTGMRSGGRASPRSPSGALA